MSGLVPEKVRVMRVKGSSQKYDKRWGADERSRRPSPRFFMSCLTIASMPTWCTYDDRNVIDTASSPLLPKPNVRWRAVLSGSRCVYTIWPPILPRVPLRNALSTV